MACEIDHIQPYDNGGQTVASNLQPLCKRHHQAKTHSTPVRTPLTRPTLTSHALADLAPLHARLAELQQQLDELTELGLADTTLETHIRDLDTEAIRLFDGTIDERLADALPIARQEGAITVMLRQHLTRHHGRTCHANVGPHQLRHCPTLSPPTDTPPF